MADSLDLFVRRPLVPRYAAGLTTLGDELFLSAVPVSPVAELIHVFKTSRGLICHGRGLARALVVGGGGTGGGGAHGGGGGGGGVIDELELEMWGDFEVTVGAGGQGGYMTCSPGGESSLAGSAWGAPTVTAAGGGFGGAVATPDGGSTWQVALPSGGSSGGGGIWDIIYQMVRAGAAGSPGGDGGAGAEGTTYGSLGDSGGGGGGAGEDGEAAVTSIGGDGGDGVVSGIMHRWENGSEVGTDYYGGGGGGAPQPHAYGVYGGQGGAGGGGNGGGTYDPDLPSGVGAGAANTGGGGGGCGFWELGHVGNAVCKNGGSGIAVIRYSVVGQRFLCEGGDEVYYLNADQGVLWKVTA